MDVFVFFGFTGRHDFLSRKDYHKSAISFTLFYFL